MRVNSPSTVKVNTPEFLELVQDTRRFILFCKPVVEHNPLQVFTSSLIFSPSRSITKEYFKHEELDWISVRPEMGAKWSACLQTLKATVSLLTWSPSHTTQPGLHRRQTTAPSRSGTPAVPPAYRRSKATTALLRQLPSHMNQPVLKLTKLIKI